MAPPIRAWIGRDAVQRRLPLAAATLGSVFLVLVFHPGLMSPDSFTQMEQARSGVLTDAHPPLLVFFWMVAELFVIGPFLMLVGQVLLVMGGVAMVARHLTDDPRRQAAIVLAVALFPPTASILGVIWKDIWLEGFVLWAVHFALLAWRGSRWWALAAVASMWLAAGMRHNGLAAVAPVAVLLAVPWLAGWRVRAWWRGVATVAAGGVLSVAVFGTVSAFQSAVVSEHESYWQVLAAYDLAGISAREDELLIPEHRLRPGSGLSDVEEAYSPRSLLPLQRRLCSEDTPACGYLYQPTTDPELLSGVSTAWVDAILAHPGAYLDHRADVFRELVGLTKDGVWSPYAATRFSADGEFVTPPSPFAAAVADLYERLSDTVLYRPFVYLLALLVLAALAGFAVARTGGRTGVVHLVLAASGLLYAFSYFPLAPSPGYRYTHLAVVCTVLVGLAATDLVRDVRRPAAAAQDDVHNRDRGRHESDAVARS